MPFIVTDETRRRAEQAKNRVNPLFDRMTSVKSAYELAKHETLGAYLDTYIGKKEAASKSDKIISAKEANKMFPEIEERFTEDVNIEVAKFIAKRHRKKRLLEAKINYGPNDFLQSTMNFGASFAGQMTDPVNIGAGMAAGLGLAGVVARIPFIGAGVQAGLRSGPIGASLTREFIGNVAVEPLNLMGASQARDTMTLSDSVMNVTAGTIVGSSLELGASKLFSLSRDTLTGRASNKFNAAKSQLDGDTSVRLDKAGDLEISNRIDFDKIQMDTDYTFRKFDGNTPSGRFIKATTSSSKTVGLRGNVKPSLTSDGFIQFTDNPQRAVKSIFATSKKKGRVIESNFDDLNLVDADRNYDVQPKSVQNYMKNDLGKTDGTLKQAMDSVSGADAQKLGKFEEVIKENGFDGFHHTEANVSGERSNVFNLTEEAEANKLFEQGVHEISPNSVTKEKSGKKLAQEHFDPAKNPENSLVSDAESKRLAQELPPLPNIKEDSLTFDAEADISTDVESIVAREYTNPESKKIVENSKKQFDALETEAQSTKAFIHCMGN